MTFRGYIVERLPDGRIKVEGYAPMTEAEILLTEFAEVVKLV